MSVLPATNRIRFIKIILAIQNIRNKFKVSFPPSTRGSPLSFQDEAAKSGDMPWHVSTRPCKLI